MQLINLIKWVTGVRGFYSNTRFVRDSKNRFPRHNFGLREQEQQYTHDFTMRFALFRFFVLKRLICSIKYSYSISINKKKICLNTY